MPAAAEPPEEAQLFWGPNGHPHNVLLFIQWEHYGILLHLLVPFHQPSEQGPPAEHSQSLLQNIGLPVRALSTLCEQQTLRSAVSILQDPSHVLFSASERLPSGCQLCCPGCKTQRRRATSVPKAVQILNSQPPLSLNLILVKSYPQVLTHAHIHKLAHGCSPGLQPHLSDLQ